MSPFQPVHIKCSRPFRARGAFHRPRPPRAPFRGPSGALRPLAGGAAAARVHRCSKTSTRPLLARYSRAPSRPRALVRLLQMYVSTSTTEDRPNIPNHRNPWLGRLPLSAEGRPSIDGNRRRYAGSGAENTASRHSPPRLLAAETSPRPRSLRAPPVASIDLFPVRRDAGRRGCRRRRARLHHARSVRVVRRRISAKRPGVHQPEGPSVGRLFASEQACVVAQQAGPRSRQRLFHRPTDPGEGRSLGP